MMKSIVRRSLKQSKYILLISLLIPFSIIVAFLPYRLASSFGGIICQLIGYFMKGRNQIAKDNLLIILPEANEDIINHVISGAWNNLGRIIAELINLRFRPLSYLDKVITVNGMNLCKEAASSNKATLFISAHYGNWEILSIFIQRKLGRTLNVIYKKSPSNIFNRITCFFRRIKNQGITNINAVRTILKLVKQKQLIGLLVDQKVDNGTILPFFEVDATTSTLPGLFAVNYHCNILMVKIDRDKSQPHKLKLSFINIANTSNDDVMSVSKSINKEFENWIKARPDQWLLFHRRWQIKKT